jgi:hypothetical protein
MVIPDIKVKNENSKNNDLYQYYCAFFWMDNKIEISYPHQNGYSKYLILLILPRRPVIIGSFSLLA